MNIYNNNYLLPFAVKRDNLISQHKLHIGKPQIVGVYIRQLLVLTYNIVGEKADRSAVKGRNIVKLRGFVFRHKLLKLLHGLTLKFSRFSRVIGNCNCFAEAFKAYKRISADKRITRRHLTVADTFKQKTVLFGLHTLKHTYRRVHIGVTLDCQRNYAVAFCKLSDLLKT